MRSFQRLSIFAFCMTAVAGGSANAQSSYPFQPPREIDFSGPRLGLTVLGSGSVDRLKQEGIQVSPVVSQFGWQFEKRFYTSPNGVTMLTEFVPLVSGLEQDVALPSLNWLVGVRRQSGLEFGIGPNITPLGTGLVVAAGVTVRSGAINVPINVAVVTSKSGPRVSVMTGFNIRRR